ncbi:sensor histidine kinase [Aquabacterium sp. CECT 9606]|uniref:sensor histidine kinase n=1 Tax=Aquabacterium sp. CECT 9606 TaxID=2845822 RepID=UPI001E4E81F0|nr:sensor histidine kinase [Aquabacterium sp. CECT 9606]CAH0356210.1 Sensor protein QseC [Aquabacterium sp. CECT 9606]
MPDLRVPTLRRRLLLSLLAPLLMLAALSVMADYLQARRLADESYDQVLASTAIGLASRLELERDGDLQDHLPQSPHALPQLDEQSPLLYAVFDAKGKTVAGLEPLMTIAKVHAHLKHPYFHDEMLQGVALRVATYAYDGPEGRGTIVVAETPRKRQQAARLLMKSTAWTSVLMVLFTLSAVYFGVRHALRPLDDLSQRLELREAKDLQALSLDGVPGEARPLVIAANQLMERLKASAQAQQDFLSNTAHQLRTPLAGLQTQLELLRDHFPTQDRERIQHVFGAVQRLGHLTHQMLALARSDPNVHASQDLHTVDLCLLLEDVASSCLDRALAKGLDLGFEPSPATVLATPWMLHELLINLVDNAIAYTPRHGRVTVSCGMVDHASGRPVPYLAVEDTGRGIAPSERGKVFERFYRTPGSLEAGTGLGLAIVREIAKQHQACIELGSGADGMGTRVRVLFLAEAGAHPDIP